MSLEPQEILECVSPSRVTVTLLILYSVSLKILLSYLKVTETSGPNIFRLFSCVYHSTTSTLCPLGDPGLDLFPRTPQTDLNDLFLCLRLLFSSIYDVCPCAWGCIPFFTGIRYRQTVWDRMSFCIIQFSECT